jgi:hypothetical protein
MDYISESRRITFEPIRPENFSLAFQFLRDSFAVSFGSDPGLWPNRLGELTAAKYSESLQLKLAKNPSSAVHVFDGQDIIGQIELSVKKDDNSCGYVSLYYLVPERRGQGLGTDLDRWKEIGAHPNYSGGILMEKALGST